jgi:signal transduction histidine kinase
MENIKQENRWYSCKHNLLVTVAGVLITSYIIILLTNSYYNLQEIKKEKTNNFITTHKNSKLFIESVLNEAKSDILNLAFSRELKVFFANKALGTSMKYGLKLSIPPIKELFSNLQKRRKIIRIPLFKNIVLLDKNINIITSIKTPTFKKDILKKALNSSHKNAKILILQKELVISVAYYFRNVYSGQLLAVINKKALEFILNNKTTNLHKWIIGPDNFIIGQQKIKLDQLPTQKIYTQSLNNEKYVFYKTRLNSDKFYFVLALPEKYIATNTLNNYILILGLLIVIIIAFITIVVLNTKTRILKEISDKLKQDIQEEIEKNIQKDEIITKQSKLAYMGEMISNIAHQWRQPLTVIGLMISDLEYAYENNELTKEKLIEIDKAAIKELSYLSKTIDDFSNFFSSTQKKNFDVTNAIKDTIYFAFRHEEGIKINLQAQEIYMVNGFENEFKQVVMNIINNAKDKAIEKKIKNPQINIEIKKNNNNLEIYFKDNAGGIKEQIIDKIFEPYFTTKFKSRGTGLGLYMAKMIIERNMNGNLSAYNQDGGAVFKITMDAKSN